MTTLSRRTVVEPSACSKLASACGSQVVPAFQCQYQSPVCLLKGRLNCSPADPEPSPRLESPAGTTRETRGEKAGRPGPSMDAW